MNKKKTQGEVFTPKSVISYMLDLTYEPEKMDYILEPGCGDSRFIIEIIKRLIKKYENDPKTLNSKISKIYGLELDSINYNNSLEKIENLLINFQFITERPKIINCDALFNEIINTIKFSYIVGNPPYVRIHNLKEEYKNLLKSEYIFLTKGMVDLYYAFFELYKKCLASDGVLCYISPSSYLYNNSGEKMLEILYKEKMISKILDFKSEKVFENASTYTCITILKSNSSQIDYSVIDKNFEIKKTLSFLYDKMKFDFLAELQKNNKGKKFSEYYKIKTGIATLADKIFILKNYTTVNGLVFFEKDGHIFQVENILTKNCIKGSKVSEGIHKIIFPYKMLNGKNVPLTEQELSENFPHCYNYLNTYKEKLLMRDKGKIDKDKWFLWGRTQGINGSDGNKIIISPMFIDTPFTYFNENLIVYSGYYIKSEIEPSLLKSEIFLESLKKISKPISQGWFSLQKKILENVVVDISS
jgi:adenine-specific DNA-methyltransferase